MDRGLVDHGQLDIGTMDCAGPLGDYDYWWTWSTGMDVM